MSEWLDLARGPIDSDDSFNLAVIQSAGGVVLGEKTRGFGKGKLALPGGKDRYYLSGNGIGLVPGNVEVSREVFEETGLAIDPRLLTQVAMLNVDTEGDTKSIAVYTASTRKVQLTANNNSADIVNLDWHEVSTLSYDDTPPDYQLWLPHVLSGYAVTAYFETENDHLFGGKIYRQRIDPIGRMELLIVEAPSA